MWPKRHCSLRGPSRRLHLGIRLGASSTHLVCALSHLRNNHTSPRIHALPCVALPALPCLALPCSLVLHPPLHLQSVGLYMLL